MNTKPLKWYYSAGFSHIPTKKTELLFASFTFQKFQRIDTQNDQKNWSQRCIFHHNKPHRLMFLMVNIPTSQRIGVGAGFIATIFFRQLGISPGPGVFFVGNPCKKWGKFRLRNQSKLMERTSFCLNPRTGLKFEPPKTTKNRPYSWNLALLEGLGKHLAERSCQRLMNQIWGQMV